HGERIDHVEPSFVYTSTTPYDPPLTPRGKRQAKQTGTYIYTLQQENVSTKRNVEYNITMSPFARTTETAIDIAKGILASKPESKIKFRIDPSLAEWHNSAYYAQAVPNNIIDKRFEELREIIEKEKDEYSFEFDESYTPVSNLLPKYPEGIHEIVKRCQKALVGISSPYIEKIKQERRLKSSEDNIEKLNTDVVLIIVTHGFCFNIIQEACSKVNNWKDAGYCAISRAKWIPKEDDEVPDIQITVKEVNIETTTIKQEGTTTVNKCLEPIAVQPIAVPLSPVIAQLQQTNTSPLNNNSLVSYSNTSNSTSTSVQTFKNNTALKQGTTFTSHTDFVVAVQEFSMRNGFTMRLNTVKRNREGIVRWREIVCSRSGTPSSKKSGIKPIRNRPSQRCDCPFLIRASVNANTGLWEIISTNLYHNHETNNRFNKSVITANPINEGKGSFDFYEND
ncbi:19086_t:CDS:2, partial [Funneliformis geosporum]